MSIYSNKSSIALISTRPLETEAWLNKPTENISFSLFKHPLTKINPLNDYKIFDTLLKNIVQYDHIIFISTNAVKYFLKRFNEKKIILPKNIKLSCIGPSTKEMLEKNLNMIVHCPQGIYDSENLLMHEIFTFIENKNILIIRGEGGRETLKTGLELKKANVIYGECYTRKYLALDLQNIKKIVQKFDQVYMLISSLESAKKFMAHEIDKNLDWLSSVNFVVNHQKIRDELKPFSKTIITSNISLGALQKIIIKK